jgi:DNA-binding NtrC family response regulator
MTNWASVTCCQRSSTTKVIQVEVAENAAQARAARLRERPDLVLLDIWMPDTDGVTLLKEWSATGALTMPVIMMSGHATIDTAVEATRIGAMAFLEKPITLQKLLKAVEQWPDKRFECAALTVASWPTVATRGVDGDS